MCIRDRSNLQLTLISQPNILISIREPLPIDFDQILPAQTPHLPPLHLKIIHYHRMLPRYRTVRQLEINFVIFVLLGNVSPFLVATDEEDSVCYVFLPV